MTLQSVSVIGRWSGFHTPGRGVAGSDAAIASLISVLDTIRMPIVVVRRRDITIAGFNRAARDVLRMSPSDVGSPLHDVPALLIWPQLEDECRDVIASGIDSRIDLRDGNMHFDVRLTSYAGGDRAVSGTVLTFTDVSAFSAGISQAVYERECTKAILNTVADPLVVLGANQEILSGNRAFYAMFDVSREEAQGIRLTRLGDGAFAVSSLRTRLRRALGGARVSRPVEVAGVATKMGRRTLSLDVHPLSFPGHSARRALVKFQDITARKLAEAAKDLRTEEELRRSEAFLAEGQRLTEIGTFSWRVPGGEVAWSKQLYRIYGLKADSRVTHESLQTYVHPEDLGQLAWVAEQARAGRPDFEWQYRLIMPDRTVRYLQAVAHATHDADGQLEYIAAIQDVTARRLSEQDLAKARSELATVSRFTSLGVLTASIAHEVNQPLAGIITNAGTCLRMLDANPPNVEGARETARRTIRDGNRAADVIKRLRALFRKDALALESLDLNEVAREVIALALTDLQRHRLVLETDFAADLPLLSGDRIQLQQVILNLIRNATDAMADVQTRPRQLQIKTVRLEEGGIQFSVRDAGVGLEKENMNKLLDAFYTTKSDGMGIGLAVSRSIIERHRGRLWAEPNDGPGATFFFSIPNDTGNAIVGLGV
jgi:PAS domain S-box-containing protein